MQRLRLTAIGDPAAVLALESIPRPDLSSDGLLVKMEAATINAVDFMLMSGSYSVKPSLPFSLGAEGVGRVIATGESARAFMDKRVIMVPTLEQGTWADEIVVGQGNVVVVPDEADPLQLAMIGINPATAYLVLKQYAHLMPGDWIGLTAANSAMGQYIIKLAKLAGLRTLNVVRRQEVVESVLACGGDKVVVEGNDLSEQIARVLGTRKLRLVLDAVGGSVTGELISHLKPNGTVVSYALLSGEWPLLSGPYLYNNLTYQGFSLMNWMRTAPRDEIHTTYQGLADLTTQKSLSANVDATYRLDQYLDAFAHTLQSHRTGKILFRF